MSTGENKRIALAFLASSVAGKRDETLLSDEVRWWVPGRGNLDLASFSKLGATLRTVLAGPFEMEIAAVTAEEDRVAIECHGNAPLVDGQVYRNSYHFLFRLRGGKICEIHEHNHSLIPYILFGERMPPMPDLPVPV